MHSYESKSLILPLIHSFKETIHIFIENRCPTYYVVHFQIPNRSVGVGFILMTLGQSSLVHFFLSSDPIL